MSDAERIAELIEEIRARIKQDKAFVHDDAQLDAFGDLLVAYDAATLARDTAIRERDEWKRRAEEGTDCEVCAARIARATASIPPPIEQEPPA